MAYDRPALQLREYVQIVRALTTEGTVDWEGEYYRMSTGFRLEGASPFPIVVSALAPLMLRLAGEVADGTVTWMAGVTALRRHVVSRLREAASAAGRPEPRVVVGVPVAVTDDGAEGRGSPERSFGYTDVLRTTDECSIVARRRVRPTWRPSVQRPRSPNSWRPTPMPAPPNWWLWSTRSARPRAVGGPHDGSAGGADRHRLTFRIDRSRGWTPDPPAPQREAREAPSRASCPLAVLRGE